MRVYPPPKLAAHFEMQVRAGRVSGDPHCADCAALEDSLAAADINRVEVGIECLPAVSVVDHNNIAIAIIIPTRINYDTVIGGENAMSDGASNVNRFMDARNVVVPRDPP